MIRAVDNKPLELNDDEFEYYVEIIKTFGNTVFKGTFEVEENEASPYYGFITLVKPPMDKNLPLGAVYFLMNCMLNQRIRVFEKTIEELKNEQKKDNNR